MRHITLNNGLTMPQLGFGVWRIEDDQAHTAVTTALRSGYRSIDTASMYRNESGVGRAIRDSDVAREDVFLTTNLWNSDQGYDRTLRAFDASLERLGTDYVDLYLIHWPVPDQNRYVESFRAMEKIQADGRARSIGVSNFTVQHLERLMRETDVVPAVNQIELHPYLAQSQLRAFGEQHGIFVEAWSPLGQGGELLNEPTVVGIGEKYGKSPAQVIIRWHLQLGNIVIPKSVTPSRIRANINVFDFELDENEVRDISALDRDGRIGANPATMNSVG